MNNTSKDQQECDVICKNHSTRSERDLYRVCPSKLSKHELENLYFALVENNSDLKKALHSQQEKLKVLSTKLQRMTVVQRNAAGKEKDCCASKVQLKEQKEAIAELEKANERLADRIRILNMRLCSAKQFLKRSPSQMARCPRCANAPVSFKNSLNALNVKSSKASIKMNAVSCQYLSEDAPESPKSAQVAATETDLPEKIDSEKPCSENKCRTLMDELKQKILNLQEELSRTHDEYSDRISKLENDVADLNNENLRVKSNIVASENALEQGEKKAQDLKGKLREAEGKISDITMQLVIEKRKVAELETALKLASTSSQIVQVIEKLNILKQQKPQNTTDVSRTCSVASYRLLKQATDIATSPAVELASSPKGKEETVVSKSDDSGCTDLNKSSETEQEKVMEKINREMLTRISELQTQLDTVRIKAAGEAGKVEKQSSSDLENYENERQLTVVTMTEERPNVVLEIQDLNAANVKGQDWSASNIETSTPVKNQENPAEKAGGSEISRDVVNEKDTNKHIEYRESMSPSGVQLKRSSAGKISLDTCNDNVSDNKYQIPGPIPVLPNKDKKKAFRNRRSISKESKEKEKMTEERSVKINENQKYSKDTCDALKNNASDKGVKNNDAVTSNIKDKTDKINESERNVDFKVDTPQQTLNAKPKNEILDSLADSNSPGRKISSDTSYNANTKISDEIGNGSKEKGFRQLAEDGSIVKPKEDRISAELPGKRESTSSYFHASEITIGPLINYHNVAPATKKEVATSKGTAKDTFFDVIIDEYGTQFGIDQASSRLQNTDTIPQSVADSSTRRDSATNATDPLAFRESAVNSLSSPTQRDSATYNAAPSVFKDSAVTAATLAGRRDSATNSRAPLTFRDSAVSAVATRRDSATYNAVFKDTATQKAADVFRGSATYSAEVAPVLHNGATATKPATYNLDSKCSRATSPDNTEREISSLSDLPPEKDGKCPSPPSARSPGEADTHTDTRTDTDTHTDTRTDYGALSEGELPVATRDQKYRKLSFGEKTTYVEPAPGSPNSQMEATLNAISVELARCRQLLASSRSQEEPYPERVHRLQAARRLPDTRTRTAVFTLHIGTLVLSDEAVLNSRDKSLILMWKFYDQSVAMARMRSGRVVLFDFSTEYDVTLSEEFLRYMKQEEMPLTICEMNKQDEPFATCSLPLRDALLHTNRRADMSLALVAGPAMSGVSSDTLASGDEVGVLDLWCLLRADRALLRDGPTPRSLLGPTKEEYSRRSSRSSRTDDDRSETRISEEIAIRPTKAYQQPDCKICERPMLTSTSDWAADLDTTVTRNTNELRPEYPDVSRSYRRRSSPSQKLLPDTLHSSKTQVGFGESWHSGSIRRRSSGVIAREVPVNIKSLDEMKQALERNVQPLSSVPKMDDDVSPAQSSIGSLKPMARKHQLQKLNSRRCSTGMPVPESLQDLLKKERKMSIAAAKHNALQKSQVPFSHYNSREEDEIDPAIVRKYDNIGKLLGSNRGVDWSRKTVKYTDGPNYEEPERQDSSEENLQTIEITVLWLALNEECEAMLDPQVQRLYVAYSFLGRRGADLETPVSLPKPKHYADKCYFNFKKTFHVHESDMPLLAHMSRCRAGRAPPDPRHCLVFTVVSEPAEDPLGLSACLDIGHADVYLGDILAYSAGSAAYTEAAAVRGACGVCGVLAVRVAGLRLLRRALARAHTLPNDMENYIQYQVMGSVSQVRMKSGCIPRRFECQPDRRKRTCNTTERPYVLKKQRKLMIEDIEKDSTEKSTLTEHLECPGTSSESSVLHTTEEHQESEETGAITYPKSADKSIQVYIAHKFRSKAIQTETKLVSQLTSPIKPDCCSVSTSPFKVKNVGTTKPGTSSPSKAKETRRIFTIEDQSDSDISYTPSITQRETSPSTQSLQLKSTSDCSELYEETKKEEASNILKYTLLKIIKNPRSYIGLPIKSYISYKSCCYLLDLIEEQTKIPTNHILLCLKKIRQNIPFRELADDFAMSTTYASKIFFKNIPVIASIMQPFLVKFDKDK